MNSFNIRPTAYTDHLTRRARAKALTDLVEGSATIETVVTLTVAAPSAEEGASPASCDPGVRPVATPETDDRPAAAGQQIHAWAEQETPDSAEGRVTVSAGQSADLLEVAGLTPGEPALVERAWVERAVASTRTDGHDRRGRLRVIACHPITGALTDPHGDLSTDAYRPGKALTALIKARDGRCRFPGCHVSARFCDLDHVTPWPTGPTAATNLVCLCRRHHRVKQRPGWGVALDPDGTLTWTDPTGRARATHPVDTLHALTLPAAGSEQVSTAVSTPRTVVPDGPHTALEFAVEHHLAGTWRRPRPRQPVDQHPPTATYRVEHDLAHRSCHRRGRTRPTTTDPPPF